MNIPELLDRLICVLYPHRCVLCGTVVEYGDMLCPSCTPELDPMVVWQPHPTIRCLLAPLPYKDKERGAVLNLKNSPNQRIARFFAHQISDLMGEHWEVAFNGIVPVPPNPLKRKRLGFHHAELLGDALSEALGIPVISGVLRRTEESHTQHELTPAERRENAYQSYRLDEGQAHLAAGKRLLLLDDIKTTGSTLFACADLLHTAGAAEVYAVAATHTIYQP